MSGLLNAFGFGNNCNNDCGDDNFIWIIIILLLFSGNGFGNDGCCNDGCNNGLFGGDFIWIIVLVLLFCGNGFGLGGNNNCGCCDTDCTCEV